MADPVDLDELVGEHDRAQVALARAAHQRFDPRLQFGLQRRLRDAVVGAAAQRRDPFLLVVGPVSAMTGTSQSARIVARISRPSASGSSRSSTTRSGWRS